MKSLQEQAECPHNRTIEIYIGIYKCSECGAVMDKADEQMQATRIEQNESSRQMQQRRASRIRYYTNRKRRNRE